MTSLAAALVLVSPALGAAAAQDIDVTASLDVTDGWARVGAYVPVTLKVTNNTDRAVAEVHVSTGGPVDLRLDPALASRASFEELFPVFYVGGDITLDFSFYDAEGACIARTRTLVPDVRPLPEGTLVLWLGEGAPEPNESERASLLARLGGNQVYAQRSPPLSPRWWSAGIVDAIGVRSPRGDRLELSPVLPPVPGVRAMVQPEAYALLASPGGSADSALWFWLGLAVFVGAVLAVSVMVPRRRVLAVAVGLLVMAGAATMVVWMAGGGGDEACVREWSLRWADPAEDVTYEENLWMLESAGCPRAGFNWGKAFPLPVFASPDAAFRPFGTIYGDHMPGNRHIDPLFKAVRPRCLVHRFLLHGGVVDEFAVQGPLEKPPANLANRADVVAALVVRGSQATAADGRSQPIDAWAVQWKTGGDADLAWAGRSLAWWDRHRRSGDGPFLVAWIRDPAPPPPPGIDVYERLPAMVVYCP